MMRSQWSGMQTPLSSVSLSPPQSQNPSLSSWNYGAGAGNMDTTPLRYTMGRADSMTGLSQTERPGRSYGDSSVPNYLPPQSSFALGNSGLPPRSSFAMGNTAYLSTQSSPPGAAPFNFGGTSNPFASLPDYRGFGQGMLGGGFQTPSYQQPYMGPV